MGTENSIFQKAADLPPHVREALESWLGRAFQPDESVSVRTYVPKRAPSGEARTIAFNSLLANADRIAARVPGIPDEEIDTVIDEAASFVRHNRG